MVTWKRLGKMPKGIKKLSKEWKKNIGLANAKKLKGRICSQKGLDKIIQMHKNKKERLGYINSKKTRKKLSDIMKAKWKNGEITKEQIENCSKMGERGISTRFKKGHDVPIEWRNIVKKSRLRQTFPSKNSSIEIKIQGFLKQLGIEFLTHQRMNLKDSYQCDIFVPSKNLVIEVDGDYWHGNLDTYKNWNNLTQKQKIQKIRDYCRTNELKEKGFKVWRLWECDIKKMELNNFKEKINGGL